MVMQAHDAEAALIESVCERVRERMTAEDAARAEEFVRQYYWRAPADDLLERDTLDLYGAALAHLDWARRRTPGEPRVRVYNPSFEQDGWQSPHTAVEIVTDDMPFLVDSISMELSRQESGIHVNIHPVVRVRRGANGELEEVVAQDAAPQDGELVESFMHIEVDRQSEQQEHETLARSLLHVLAQVRATVDDWPAMRERARELIDELEQPPPGLEAAEVDEARALLVWLEDHHFTFLGYREYELGTDGDEDVLRPVAGTELGILRDAPRTPRGFSRLPARVRALARAPQLLVLTKANARSPVHRSSYLDYVGVKRFGADGEVVGERRFVGLYTTAAYRSTPHAIPVVRRKAAAVIERAAYPRGSHDEKALIEIIDTYPRDELFQIPEDELYAIATGILDLGERQRVRLFVRHDRYERFVSCLVFLPRDRFHTQNRERVGEILREEFQGESVDWELRLSESVLVRIHYVVHVPPGELPDVRRGQDRGADRRGDARVERRARGRARRGVRRGGWHRALPPLRPGVAGRLPRRLARPLGGRRPAAARGAGRRRRARHEPLPPARGARRHVPLQALPARRARIAVRRAADVREHGARGARRAPLPRHAARGRSRPGSTTSACTTRSAPTSTRTGSASGSTTASRASGTATSSRTDSTR